MESAASLPHPVPADVAFSLNGAFFSHPRTAPYIGFTVTIVHSNSDVTTNVWEGCIFDRSPKKMKIQVYRLLRTGHYLPYYRHRPYLPYPTSLAFPLSFLVLRFPDFRGPAQAVRYRLL